MAQLDKASAYGAGDCGFKSRCELSFCFHSFFLFFWLFARLTFLDMEQQDSVLGFRCVAWIVCFAPFFLFELVCLE